MNSPSARVPRLSRRRFLRSGGGLGLLGLAAGAHPTARAAAPGRDNPWAYDVSRYETTDPQWIRYREARRFPAPRADARRLVVGPDGRVWLGAGNYLVALDEAGEASLEIALSGPVRCLAVAPEGAVFAGLRDHVEVFDARGNRQAVWEAPPGRVWLSGLLVTAEAVFAADSGNRVVWRFDRAGRVAGRIGDRDPARGIPGFALPSPHLDVELHPDGRLRINNTGRHLVETYTFEGERLAAWGKPGMGLEAFCGCCNPIALAVLPDGRIVTAEKGLPRVKVYTPDGRLDAVVAGVESFPENLRATRGESRNDTLNLSLDVAADARGRIFILEPVSATVRVMIPVERT